MIGPSCSYQTWCPNSYRYCWTSCCCYSSARCGSYSCPRSMCWNRPIWRRNKMTIREHPSYRRNLRDISNIPIRTRSAVPTPRRRRIGFAVATPSISRRHWWAATTSTHITKLLHRRPDSTRRRSSPTIHRPIVSAAFCETMHRSWIRSSPKSTERDLENTHE